MKKDENVKKNNSSVSNNEEQKMEVKAEQINTENVENKTDVDAIESFSTTMQDNNQFSNQTNKGNFNNSSFDFKAMLDDYLQKLKTDKVVLGVTIAVVLMCLFLFCGIVSMGTGSKKVVNTYAKAMVKFKSKKITKLYHEDYIDYMESHSKDDIEDIIEESFEKLEDKDYRFLSYDIIDKEKYNKNKLEEYAEDLEDLYDIDEDDIKSVVEYTLKFKVDDDGDKDTKKVEIHAVKVKGKWYIFD